jgi:hypothetical protein
LPPAFDKNWKVDSQNIARVVADMADTEAFAGANWKELAAVRLGVGW